MFKAICPYISQAIVIGQARNFVHDAITLDPDAITGWAAGRPAGRQDLRGDRAPRRETAELVEGYVEELNAKLNRWETIKKFTILPRDLTIEDGELTPSMKIKRRGVEANFAERSTRCTRARLAETLSRGPPRRLAPVSTTVADRGDGRRPVTGRSR